MLPQYCSASFSENRSTEMEILMILVENLNKKDFSPPIFYLISSRPSKDPGDDKSSRPSNGNHGCSRPYKTPRKYVSSCPSNTPVDDKSSCPSNTPVDDKTTRPSNHPGVASAAKEFPNLPPEFFSISGSVLQGANLHPVFPETATFQEWKRFQNPR
jgi:hypothetical protein